MMIYRFTDITGDTIRVRRLSDGSALINIAGPNSAASVIVPEDALPDLHLSLAPSGAKGGEHTRTDALPVASAEPGPDGEDDGPARASIEESTP